MPAPAPSNFRWLQTGDETFAAMLAAIAAAQKTVRLEMYIFADCPLGERFREMLLQARQRGVRVQVLIDSFGSLTLAYDFWEPLTAAGGEFRWFNPLTLARFGFRNHRKLLVCDDTVAVIGGFNIAPEWEGDGVARGWCDLGLQVTGLLAGQLAVSADDMFARADFRHKRFTRLRKAPLRKAVPLLDGELLLNSPGRGRNPIKRALLLDFNRARRVQIIAAYFLPPLRLRRALTRVARRGGQVQLLLAGQSDVPLSQLAARSLYRRLLRAGVEIYEYQPQILHAKLIIVDDVVYIGSANLDSRSLHINYELLVRLTNSRLVGEARAIFAQNLALSRRIEWSNWRKSHTFWDRWKGRWAYFILAKMDPWIAHRQWRGLRHRG